MGDGNDSDDAVEENEMEEGQGLGLQDALRKREEDDAHVDDEKSEIGEEDAHVAADVLNTPLHGFYYK